MRNVRAGMAGVLAALWLGPVPLAQAEAHPGQVVDNAQGREVSRSQRLRFRSGPVCMCANGLGEKEIEAAERRRLESIVEPQDGTRR